MGPSAKRRKLNTSTVEEINFDDTAREDYLTGFHKRKQARIKHAQELAVKKEREEKIRDRAALRQKRKEELDAHVKAMALALKGANCSANTGEESDGSEEEWEGFDEAVGSEQVNHEDEYIDEEKYTTVTVESVDITKEGFAIPGDSDEEDDEDGDTVLEIGGRSGELAKSEAKKKKKDVKAKPKKKKKKKFRYESKVDRKVERFKQKSKNSLQAQRRKGKS